MSTENVTTAPFHDQCPVDRAQCRYYACEDGPCARLEYHENNYTAEAQEIAEGFCWLGFWVGLGIIAAAVIWALK